MRRLFPILLLASSIASGQMFPGDGAVLTIYKVEGGDPCDYGYGTVCDLSEAVIADRHEMEFEYFGDTLVSRRTGLRLDWFRVKGDTVLDLGTNTRQQALRYHHGMPYLLPGVTDACVAVDTTRYLSFMIYESEGMSATRYSADVGCGFIFSSGDTIATTYCVHTVTTDSLYTSHDRRWYAQGCVWPVVEQVTLSLGEQSASAVYICPPSEQPSTRHNARGTDNRLGRDPYALIAQGATYEKGPQGEQRFTVSAEDGKIRISVRDNTQSMDTGHNPTNESGPGQITGGIVGGYNVRIYDVAGRQWMDTQGQTEIDTTFLFPGTYIIEITSSGTTESHKVKI